MINIADIRKDYKMQSLLETDVASNAITQFDKWWDDAIKSQIDEVNAMTLATATATGIPSARIVLLKGYNKKGFVFFTNYSSRKAQEIVQNSNVCLVFFWAALERQVRINGIISKINDEESDAYFLSRPLGSRIGAWASAQSTIIKSRAIIEDNLKKITEKFSNNDIPRPKNWGGYIVKPTQIEFWQGRPNRLHDRILYTLQKDATWIIERLAP